MKRYFAILMLLFLMVVPAFAGDFPEALLTEDDSQLFFGKLITFDDTAEISYIEVIPTRNIKGDIIINSPATYQNPVVFGDEKPALDKQYLFAAFPALNGSEGRGKRTGCIYVFETEGDELKNLKIKGHGNYDGDPVARLERDINSGELEEAEKNRLKNSNRKAPFREITMAEFLKTDGESAVSVRMNIDGTEYPLDKETFFKIAENTILTPVKNGKALDSDGIYIITENKNGYIGFLYITPEGSIDFNHPSFSRLPSELYRTDISFLKQLYAISPEEAQENFIDFNPVKKQINLLHVNAGVIFVLAFLAGIIVVKKRNR